MLPPVPLVLIGMFLFEALQTSAALQCYKCEGETCTPTTETCSAGQDRCQTKRAEVIGQKTMVKGCTTKTECDNLGGVADCCEKDLCNSDGAAGPCPDGTHCIHKRDVDKKGNKTSSSAAGVKLSLLMMLGPLLFSIVFF